MMRRFAPDRIEKEKRRRENVSRKEQKEKKCCSNFKEEKQI
jgi:hypothetical protein